jgi:hypothetical protein
MLYRNVFTGELVKAAIKTVKGDLTAFVTNLETGSCNKIDEEKFSKMYTKVNSIDELIPIEVMLVKRYV